MDNKFIPQAIEIVKDAIEQDRQGDYPKALMLYQRALEYFVTGLKYESNAQAKKHLQEKIVGYITRAEELKKIISEGNNPTGKGGTGTLSKEDAKEAKDEEEKNKLRSALSSSIVSEKPNVKWDDVAGLEGAKEALKEGIP